MTVPLDERTSGQPKAAAPGLDDDLSLIDAIRGGDEAAFVRLLERYHGALVRLAVAYVDDRAVAEEVAQETWIGVLKGIHRYEGRATVKTWLFSILVN